MTDTANEKAANGETPQPEHVRHIALATQAIDEAHDHLTTIRTKAEAAGVLYGEPLYRELDIIAGQLETRLRAAARAAYRAGIAFDERERTLENACHQYAADEHRLLEAVDALSGKIADLEQRIETDPRPHPPETPAPPAKDPHLLAAAEWHDLGEHTGHPITPQQALNLVAALTNRNHYPAPHPAAENAPHHDHDYDIAILDWARAGFPDFTAPDQWVEPADTRRPAQP